MFRYSLYMYDCQIVHPTHCFESFYSEYFTDNEVGKMFENNIFDVPTYSLLLDYLYITHTVNIQLNIAILTDFMFN